MSLTTIDRTPLADLVRARYALHAAELSPDERRTLADAAALLDRLPARTTIR